MTRTAVLTIVAGRHEHLRRQLRGLAAGSRRPDLQVVASMGDPEIQRVVDDAGVPWEVVVRDVPTGDPGLPLAAARNAAAEAATRGGADLLVLLDVDCIPAPGLVARYRAVSGQVVGPAPVLLSGSVGYLPPLAPGEDYDLSHLDRHAEPHPARPAPAADEVLRARDLRLFWSLSFAVSATDFAALEGFDAGYTGYGGEDTDFAMRVQEAGGSLWWVGGADAFHQHHDSEVPPVRHTASIVRNANRFHRRWGWYPMEGWLEALEQRGLVRHSEDGWSVRQADRDTRDEIARA